MSATAVASSHRDYSRHVGVGLVVLAALALLLLSVRPFGNQVENGKHTGIQADIQAIKTQLKLYESMNGFFPTTNQGLCALVEQREDAPRPKRWYHLFDEVPLDPWHNEYRYRCPGNWHPDSYDLFSPGPDHNSDTKDDDWGQ